MKTLHPEELYTPPCGGVAGGFPPLVGVPPLLGGGARSPRRKNFLVNVYCNFIVNLDVHYKVADLTVEVMLGFFSLEGNPLL
jgi:hypothetical protein